MNDSSLAANAEALAQAVLAQNVVPPLRKDGPEPPAGRLWWPEELSPPNAANGPQLWRSLNQDGRALEVLAWIAVGDSRALNRSFTDYVVAFQMQNTLVAAGDHVPAFWGRLAWQAVAALANIRWLAETSMGRGAPVLGLVREALASWFDSVTPEAPAQGPPIGWGDVLLFHRFGEVVTAWRAQLEGTKTRAHERLQAIQLEARELRAKRKKTWNPFRWWRLTSALTKAEAAGEEAQTEYSRAEAVTRDVADLAARWSGLDPLAQLPHVCKADVLPLTKLVEAHGHVGLDDWLLREMAAAAHSAGIGATGAIFGEDPAGADEAAWRRRTWVARFYHRWGMDLPEPAPPSSSDGLGIAAAARGFLKAWTDLKAVHRSMGRNLTPGGAAEEFDVEFRRAEARVGPRIERFKDAIGLIPRGPVTLHEIARWDGSGVQLEYFTDAMQALAGTAGGLRDDPAAWMLRDELLEIYERWGNLAPALEDVRRHCPEVSRIQRAFAAFFAPWLHLRRASLSQQTRRPNNQPAVDFAARYRRMDTSVLEKIDTLRSYLCGPQAGEPKVES